MRRLVAKNCGGVGIIPSSWFTYCVFIPPVLPEMVSSDFRFRIMFCWWCGVLESNCLLYITVRLMLLLSSWSLCCSAQKSPAECILCVSCCPITHVVSNMDLTVCLVCKLRLLISASLEKVCMSTWARLREGAHLQPGWLSVMIVFPTYIFILFRVWLQCLDVGCGLCQRSSP